MKFEMDAEEFQTLFKNTKLEELENFKENLGKDLSQIVNFINNMQAEINECRDKLHLPINIMPISNNDNTVEDNQENS